MHPTDYESLTIPELKDMADQLGVDVPKDTRKADIIEMLRAAVQEPPTIETQEYQNVYTRQMNSTETALITNEDFWKFKLHS